MRSHEDQQEISPDLEMLMEAKEGQLLLYREYPDGQFRYLTTFKSFDQMQIRKKYGGGRYLVILKRGGQVVKRRRFAIEGKPIIRGSIHSAGSVLGRLIDQVPAELRAIREQLETIEARQRGLSLQVARLVRGKTR